MDDRIPVLCEKPLARTRREILDLSELSRKSGILLSVAYQRRMWATYRVLRRLVRSGEFGPVRAVVSHNVENWQSTIAGTWRDDPQMNPGGFIGDAGSHKIDAVFYVTGLDPIEVFARCRSVRQPRRNHGLGSGATVRRRAAHNGFCGARTTSGRAALVHCAEADLTLRDGELWLARAGKSERVAIAEADSNPISAFLDTILLGNAEKFAPAECALPVFAFTQGLFESARSGERRLVRREDGLKPSSPRHPASGRSSQKHSPPRVAPRTSPRIGDVPGTIRNPRPASAGA